MNKEALGSEESGTVGDHTVNIAEYCEAEQKRAASDYDRKLASAEEIRTESARSLTGLKQDRDKKAQTLSQAQAEGLDTASLAEKIGELDRRIETESARSSEAEREYSIVVKTPKGRWSRLGTMSKVLAERFGCNTATVVANIESSYPLLYAEFGRVTADESGHPTAVEMGVGGGTEFQAKVKNGQSLYLKDFIPGQLDWLKRSALKISPVVRCGASFVTNGHSSFAVLLDTTSGRIALSETKLEWRQEIAKDWQGHMQYEERHEDFGDVANSLAEHVRDQLATANNEIDLAIDTAPNSLIGFLRQMVLDATTPAPRFKPDSGRLTTTEIEARIATDWVAFVASPWAWSVRGWLALLKYHAENGERPRFWSAGFDGYYGFRMRTRDHDWISG